MAAWAEQRPMMRNVRINNRGDDRFHNGRKFVKVIGLAFEHSSTDYAVTYIKEAFQMNNGVAIGQTICSLIFPSEVVKFKQRYLEVHGVQLEDDIRTFTQGPFRTLLLEYVGKLVEQSSPDAEMVDVDEMEQLSTYLDEMVNMRRRRRFVSEVTTKSPEFLKAAMINSLPLDLFENYDNSQHGPFEHAVITIMECSVNRPKYFAKVVYKAMMDPNQIDNQAIVRVITTRAKTDMNDIKREYIESYGRSLLEDVYYTFSGFECRDDLVALLNLSAAN